MWPTAKAAAKACGSCRMILSSAWCASPCRSPTRTRRRRCQPTSSIIRDEVLELLGSGGMGFVYKARHRLMDRLVALKVIKRRLTDRPGMVERFGREMKAAGDLLHPNIVTAHDAEQAGATHFLVMEYVEGVTLRSTSPNAGRSPWPRRATTCVRRRRPCNMLTSGAWCIATSNRTT